MRKPLVEMPGEDFTNAGVRAAYVVRFGPRCAAYLVSRAPYRKRLRNQGYFHLHLPSGEEEPPWLQIAIEYLSKHARRWDVVKTVVRGERRWRIRRLEWRVLPEAIVPVGIC